MQSQVVCMGCRNLLFHPRGAANVCCVICNTVTVVPPPGMEMAQLVCAGCRTLLVYARGAMNVRCSCCSTVNLVRTANQVAHVNCGQCHTTLMYPYGAPSVKCAICQYITNIGMRVPTAIHGPTLMTPAQFAPAQRQPRVQSQTVVVENPMSINENGKLVSNIVVGVTTVKK